MIQSAPPRRTNRGGTTTAGWIFSLLFHATVVLGSLLFIQQIQLAPESEPFTWDVAMVSSDRGPTPAAPQPLPPTLPEKTQRTTQPPLPPPSHTAARIEETPSSASLSQPQTASTPAPPERPSNFGTIPYSPPVSYLQTPRNSPQEPSPSSSNAAQSDSPQPATSSVDPSEQPTSETTPATRIEPTASPSPEPAPQVATQQTTGSPSTARQDYGWLTDIILRRVDQLKQYPPEARLEQAQGRVVVKIVIREDGSVAEAEIAKSSGFPTLDQAALDVLRHAGPIALSRPLGRSSLTIKIPINYSLGRS